jgi:HK97 family phage prohead protease
VSEEQNDQQQPMIVREFPMEVEVGDGRTIDARIVPYNTVARVSDDGVTAYDEMFLPGSFERQLKAPGSVKVFLNVEHEPGFRGVIGHGRELVDREDGLHGTFKVMENADGDKALELVREGLLNGISLEAKAMRSRTINGVVERVRTHLDKVSLCRFPAYKDAGVLAVRTEPLTIEPAPMSDELLERLAGLGVEPLRRVSVAKTAWDDAADRFTDDEYRQSCLIERAGDQPAKDRCLLPVLEPDGALNVNALAAAAQVLQGGRPMLRNVTLAQKADAARKLLRYYRLAHQDPPGQLVALSRTEAH